IQGRDRQGPSPNRVAPARGRRGASCDSQHLRRGERGRGASADGIEPAHRQDRADMVMPMTKQKTKLIAGNWKMNGSLQGNEALVKALLDGLRQPACDVAVCVPAPYLAQVGALVSGSPIALGAQDVSAQAQGAYTGEQSAAML